MKQHLAHIDGRNLPGRGARETPAMGQEDYGQRISSEPKNAELRMAMISRLFHLGKADDALSACGEAIALMPDEHRLREHKAYILYSLGRYGEALDEFRHAARLAENDPVTHSNLAATLVSLGRYEDAIKCCDAALAIDPAYVGSYKNRAVALHLLGRHAEALKACDGALSVNPGDADTYRLKAAALNKLGHHDGALDATDRLLEIHPDDAASHFNRGASLQELGRYKEAADAFGRAHELDPSDTVSLRNRAGALGTAGQNDEARALFEQVLQRDRSDAHAHYGLGIIHLSGDPKRALEHLDRALDVLDRAGGSSSAYAPIHTNRAHALLSLQRPGEALEACGAAVSHGATGSEPHWLRGVALLCSRRYDEALDALDHAFRVDPGNPIPLNSKGAALVALERYVDAIGAYEHALRIDPHNSAAQEGIIAARRGLSATGVADKTATAEGGAGVPVQGRTRAEPLEELAGFIGYLVETGIMGAKAVDTPDGRHKLQKYAYIAQRLGMPIGHKFDFLQTGAFSSDLSVDIYERRRVSTNPEPLAPDPLISKAFVDMVAGKSVEWLQIATFAVRDHGKDGAREAFVGEWHSRMDYDRGLIDEVFEEVDVIMQRVGQAGQ